MHSNLTIAYWESFDIPIHRMRWEQYTSEKQAYNGFSYYKDHIVAGTLLCFGWHNSYENTAAAIWMVDPRYMQESSMNSEHCKILEFAFETQFPIFAWKAWWDDLHTLLLKEWTTYKLRRVLPIVVTYVLQSWDRRVSFEQLYLKWSTTQHELMTLVWDRSGLYAAYKRVFWTDFPRDRVYPTVQQTEVQVSEWRSYWQLPPLK